MRFNAVSDPSGQPFTIDNPAWFQFAENSVYSLPSADSEVRSIRLSVPTSVPAGSYFLTFEIVDDDLSPPEDVYTSKDFFIVVRG